MLRKIRGMDEVSEVGDAQSSERFQPDDPLTFKEAAEHLLRGLVTGSTLAAAALRGELEAERLGRRVVTTPAMIRRWRDRCKVVVGQPGPPSIDPSRRHASASDLAAAQAAFLETLRAPNKRAPKRRAR